METEYLRLCISPIDDKYAELISIESEFPEGSVFNRAVKYEGYNNYYTTECLDIDTAEYEGKIYTISRIKGSAFSHCRNLRCLKIGKCVKAIPWNVYKCCSLKDILVDKSNLVYHDISGVLFKGKELVAFPCGRTGSYIVPSGTRRIGNHAFKSAKISEVIFPNSLEELGINAFYECRNIQEFILPSSIKKIYPNDNIGKQPIEQVFYLDSDIHRKHPMSIIEVMEIFKV